MQQLKSFGVFQTAKVMGVLYFLGMAVIAVLMVPLLLIAQSTAQEQMPFFGSGAVGVVLFVLVVPPLYALIAFIATAIGCAIYNLVAQWVGGIEVEIREAAR